MSTLPKVSTCFWYDRDAEPAARLYTSLVPDSAISHISRYGPGAPLPEGTAMLVSFTLAGTAYCALNGGPLYPPSEAASIVVHCGDQAEIDRLWNALTADGGRESRCGWLKDRWGVSWQIVPAQMAEWMSGPAAGAVTAAFMTMNKLDYAALAAAARRSLAASQ
jgi:predicted 3-demethylubiquinone-9 3-methyltransferase (glyoxalase superfamily)